MIGTADALVSPRAAAELLGIEEGEVGQAVAAGELRAVWYRPAAHPDAALTSYILGEDVRRMAHENDPRMRRESEPMFR